MFNPAFWMDQPSILTTGAVPRTARRYERRAAPGQSDATTSAPDLHRLGKNGASALPRCTNQPGPKILLILDYHFLIVAFIVVNMMITLLLLLLLIFIS